MTTISNKSTCEKLLPISGYEGLYKVSSDGRIYGERRQRFLKPCLRSDGYLMVRLSKNGCARHHNIHRLVAIEFIPNPHGYKEINHKDADRQNNDVSNLEWCSHQQNMAWAGKMGHMARWKDSPSEKEGKHIEPSSEEPLQRIIHLTHTNARTFPQIWENLSSDERESLTLEIYNAKCCRTRQTIWKWANDKVRPSTLVRETLAKVVSKAIGTKVYANTLFPEKS